MIGPILSCRQYFVKRTCGLAGLENLCYDDRHGETLTRLQGHLDPQRNLGIRCWMAESRKVRKRPRCWSAWASQLPASSRAKNSWVKSWASCEEQPRRRA